MIVMVRKAVNRETNSLSLAGGPSAIVSIKATLTNGNQEPKTYGGHDAKIVYERNIEDFMDIVTADIRSGEPLIPSDQVEKKLREDGLL